jgi:hypothetical protein
VLFVDGRTGAAGGGDGSAARPFATISACAAVASRAAAMSTCRVRPGSYREAVRVEAGRGVAIVGDGVGRTVLEGTKPLDGLHWERWQQPARDAPPGDRDPERSNSSKIFRAVIPPGALRFSYRQLFVDGEYITESRWPNANLSTMLDRDSAWATMKAGSGWGVVHDDALQKSGVGRNDGGGGRVTMNLGTGVFTWVRAVQNFSAANASFRYKADLPALKHSPGCDPGQPCKHFVGNRYFLQGCLSALDSAGEWFLDEKDWTLYIWMPDERAPTDGRLSVKNTDFCVRKQAPAVHETEMVKEASVPRPVQLANLSFHGCTFELLDCNNCSVQDIELLYPTYDPTAADGMDAVPATTMIQGSGATVDRVHLANTNNAGLMLVGSGHAVSEMLIESVDWLGSLAFPPLKIGFSVHHPGSVGTTAAAGLDADADLGSSRPLGVGNKLTKLTVRGFGNSGPSPEAQ